MASSSQKKLSDGRRETLQILMKSSQSASKSELQGNNKENIDPQFIQKQNIQIRKKVQRMHETQECKKKQRETFILTKPNYEKQVEYQIYNDSEIGIKTEHQKLLLEAYDRDDDIETTASIQKQFVQICLNDLEEGIKQNVSEEKLKLIDINRLKKYYEILEKNDDYHQ